jgi:hypothetical protein
VVHVSANGVAWILSETTVVLPAAVARGKAEKQGLGMLQRGDPCDSGYKRVVYRRVEVTQAPVSFRAR